MSQHRSPESASARDSRRPRTLVIAATALAVAGLAVGAVAIGSAPGGTDASPAARDSLTGSAAGADAASDGSSEAAGSEVLPAPVAAQLAYVEAHWQDTADDEFGYLDESDCVNFASQSLLARGWQVDDEWWHTTDGDPYASSDAWISSTAFRDYLVAHPERATALTDDQRDQVKVGDIVQFDWDDSGDRDHTGIVTGVTTLADGTISIEYAGHTDATFDRTVDEAIHEIHPGGVAYYWSIPQ
ncbi:CHAP domain-containing protein [Agromyces intestinalis]|uniref:CHAP domain-containing protein n=1 Tax=Agromyces intestinalis TaxID=2592652 RepID=A0A5C1YD38_9MICO|nr:amidase domain-containing protein [Agromyces intestinalis]QEO13981.1 CHAP domain-containing protein [Agromyces intestinalis]